MEDSMNRTTPVIAVSVLLVAACTDVPTASMQSPSLSKQSGGDAAYAAHFDDAAGEMLRSDGRGTYVDGLDCVTSIGGSAGGGVYQLRAIAATDPCKALQRGAWRSFTIDFGASTAPRDLDQDGVLEMIEEVPGRLLATDAFAQGSSSTPVRVLVFTVNADGSTTWDTRYELRYQANAATSGTETRVIEAVSGNAAVDLYEPVVQGRKTVWTNVVTIQLPFKLTLTP
jgi:hypothetical protein